MKSPKSTSVLQTLRHWWQLPKVHLSIGVAICAIFAIAYSLLMLHKYWQFEYFFVDNVYFHSSLWKLAQFETPIVNHPYLGQINIFGDHFHPTILLVALLFRLFPWHETVFISMAIAYSIGGFFAFLIGRNVLKTKWMMYPLLFAYFLYIGTQNAFIFGFHEINLLAPFFFFSIWALLHKRWRLYAIGLALLLLTKESMAVIGIGLAIFTWFLGKEYRKMAIATLVVSLGWYMVVTRVIIPAFSGGQFLYGNIQLPTTPRDMVVRLTDPNEKIETFVVSMASFGFLPLLNIAAVPLVLQDFIVRYVFAIPGNVQYLLTYHYGVALAPMLLLSSMWTVRWIEKKQWGKYAIPLFAAITLLGTFYGNYMLSQRAPVLLVTNKSFYQNTQNNAFLWKLVEATPWDGKVMTQNHLGLPLSQRPTYILARSYKELMSVDPDYIVYDLREGQNPNNFFPSNEEDWKMIVNQATESGKYEQYFQEGELFILKKR